MLCNKLNIVYTVVYMIVQQTNNNIKKNSIGSFLNTGVEQEVSVGPYGTLWYDNPCP